MHEAVYIYTTGRRRSALTLTYACLSYFVHSVIFRWVRRHKHDRMLQECVVIDGLVAWPEHRRRNKKSCMQASGTQLQPICKTLVNRCPSKSPCAIDSLFRTQLSRNSHVPPRIDSSRYKRMQPDPFEARIHASVRPRAEMSQVARTFRTYNRTA